MNDVFSDVLDVFVCVYLDDILVFSASEAEHAVHLRETLARLRAHGLRAKRSKCDFGVDTVEYLGHWIRSGERYMDEGKIADVVNWLPLQNVKQL